MTGASLGAQPAQAGSLALAFQEVFTAVARIRASSSRNPDRVRARARQESVVDAASFRDSMRDAIAHAVSEAKRQNYSDEEIELALLAAVGFLDESILNSGDPVFANWLRDTLCNELFGHQLAGKIFFDNLRNLRAAPDTRRVAAVLEVYRLCLLLGFRGQVVDTENTQLRSLADVAGEKIARVRGNPDTLFSAGAAFEDRPVPVAADPWNRRWLVIAAVCAFIALSLFIGFEIALDAGVYKLQALNGG